jgi:GNAT superfamily N-acetyltransferase
MIKKSLLDSMKDVINYWNKEYEFSYPLTKRIYEEKFLECEYTDFSGSYSLYNEYDYIGTIVLKIYNGDDPRFIENAYISFIYIQPKYRGQGYGTKLINDCVRKAKENKKHYLLTGTDFDNFLSGVFDLNNQITHQFFILNKFQQVGKNFNLICRKEQIIDNDEYLYRVVKDEIERQNVLEFVKKNFALRWYNDIKNCLKEEFIVALEKNKIIGFVRISDPSYPKLFNSTLLYPLYKKLGGVGPLGIDQEKRGLGIGKRIVQHAINTLFTRGCSDIIVDWTGLIDFYKKCGFDEISNQYVVYKFNLYD